MEKMLVVVFDSEKKAYEGYKALSELDNDGSITVHGEGVITKNIDGTITVKQDNDSFPVRTVAGTAIGSLVGLLGGPIGVGIGAALGTVAGGLSDVYTSGVEEDFLADISSNLTRGKYAVLAEISEEWVTPIDTRMEELGGTVFRTSKKNFEADQRAKDIAAAKLERDELKAEMEKAHSDRKAKLQAKIDLLNKKIDAKMEKGNQRLDQMKKERDAKVQALEVKRKSAQADMRARIDARIDEVRKHYEESERQFKMHTADRLERAGKGLEERAAQLRK